MILAIVVFGLIVAWIISRFFSKRVEKNSYPRGTVIYCSRKGCYQCVRISNPYEGDLNLFLCFDHLPVRHKKDNSRYCKGCGVYFLYNPRTCDENQCFICCETDRLNRIADCAADEIASIPDTSG